MAYFHEFLLHHVSIIEKNLQGIERGKKKNWKWQNKWQNQIGWDVGISKPGIYGIIWNLQLNPQKEEKKVEDKNRKKE